MGVGQSGRGFKRYRESAELDGRTFFLDGKTFGTVSLYSLLGKRNWLSIRSGAKPSHRRGRRGLKGYFILTQGGADDTEKA